MITLENIRSIVRDRYVDIVTDILEPTPYKLRLVLTDNSFIDVHISHKVKNSFSFHWERRFIDNTIYRYDNFPDVNFKHLRTFPYHLHYGKEHKALPITFHKRLPKAFVDFMEFVKVVLKKEKD